MAAPVGPGKTRRTNRRIARVRLANPKALPNIQADNRYTPREVRRVKKVDARIRRRQAAKKAAKGYNPLAPLTGPREKAEIGAATRLEFGEKERTLREEIGRREQTAANTSTYYDDWKQALREAAARVNEANRQNVEAQEGRVDAAYQQDTQRLAADDAAASEQAAKFGRAPVSTEEGKRAIEAQRSQGNLGVGRLRERGASDLKYVALREANSVQAKTEALAREGGKRDQLGREQVALAGDKGAFKTDLRRKLRSDERTYALARKEFGLKEKDLALKHKTSRADRKLERQKLNAQKIVARIYASADKAGARAQIRVAQLQLQKGKISKSQFRTIKNIYEGLPAKGQPGGSQPKATGGAGGQGSGAGGKLAPWERDKISNAVRILNKNSASITDKKKWMQAMQDEGVPARLARIAWNKYVTKRQRAAKPSPGGPRGKGTL